VTDDVLAEWASSLPEEEAVTLLRDLSTAASTFLSTYGLLAIVVVMLLKEIGIPVPVPSDLIMLTAGAQAAAGSFSIFELLLGIEFAVLIGGSAQFLLVRSAGRRFVYRVGRWVGLTPQRLDRAMAFLQRRGAVAVFLGLNLPGARAGIIPAAGLAGLGYSAFTLAMLGGSGVFYGWHIALGYLAGPSAAALLARLNLPILPVLLVLAVVGVAGWLLLRRRARRRGAVLATGHEWTEAACPVCLALAAANVQNFTSVADANPE
jgi:membrane protein DedA with SNARE-associated domain